MSTILREASPGGGRGTKGLRGGTGGIRDGDGTAGPGTRGGLGRSARRRSARVLLRPARTPAGVAVSAALSVALPLAAIETVGGLVDAPISLPPVAHALAALGDRPWSSSLVMLLALAAIVAGVLMVLLAVVPGRSRLVLADTADELAVVGVTRRGLLRTLRYGARSVAGVRHASVRMGPRGVEVIVRPGTGAPGEVLKEVGAAVGDRLAGLGTQFDGEVVVRLRGGGR